MYIWVHQYILNKLFVILLQDSLKIKLQNSIPDFLYSILLKRYTHKICTSKLAILGLIYPLFIPKLNKISQIWDTVW